MKGKVVVGSHIKGTIDALTLGNAHLARLSELLDGASVPDFVRARAEYDRAAIDLAVALGRIDRALTPQG